eukprot:jgi/Botrbrau1/22028/Bobra.0024s0042.1
MDQGPRWLQTLIAIDEFHKPCGRCTSVRQKASRETNAIFFDLDDETVACATCVSFAQTRNHRILQIRRSSYHDVVKVSDIAKDVKLQRVQNYTINGDKVVFIKTRPNPKVPKLQVGGSQCKACGRQLNDIGNWYCSLQCKLGGSLSPSEDWVSTSSNDSQPSTPMRNESHNPNSPGQQQPPASANAAARSAHASLRGGSHQTPRGPHLNEEIPSNSPSKRR